MAGDDERRGAAAVLGIDGVGAGHGRAQRRWLHTQRRELGTRPIGDVVAMLLVGTARGTERVRAIRRDCVLAVRGFDDEGEAFTVDPLAVDGAILETILASTRRLR